MSDLSKKGFRRNAEYILNNYMTEKEFWIVSGDDHNKDDLQEVLDTLFDSCENCYTTEIIKNQSSSRLGVRCNVCNVSLSSYDPFISHDKGKNHKKAIQQAMGNNNQLQNLMGPVIFKTMDDLKHNFESGSLEEELFLTSHCVLGWQFVYREIIDMEELFTCQLCDKISNCFRINQKKAFKHITADAHVQQYMMVKFNIKGSYASIYQEIQDVIEMEGKRQCKITTLIANRHTKPRTVSSSSHKSENAKRADISRSHSSSSRSRTHSRTPEKVVRPIAVSKATQMEEAPQSIHEFMQDITRHYDFIAKQGDHTTQELRKDLSGQDLINRLVKVLSQKICIYGLEHDHDIKNDAEALMKKADNLCLISVD